MTGGAIALASGASPLAAQAPCCAAPTPCCAAPALRSLAIDAGIRLDGIPDEPAWQQADSLVEFHQAEPREGEPASQRTVVRVLSARAGLYVAAWMGTADPLVRAHLRRDDSIEQDDYIALMFDPQQDRRSGVVFATNPNGMLLDGEIVSTEDISTDWNGVWDVRTHRTTSGWTAEFFIPWQNFRYAPGATAFGFNVERLMRRRNEKVLWHAWRRQQGLAYLADEGTLLVPGPLPSRETIEARPYAAISASANTRAVDTTGSYVVTGDGNASAKAGLDAKIAVAPTLTLDATINTDFAQAEADRQVVNLTRFPVFFPEQRQFFLESASIFNFGQAERTSLFNSRRIGLDSTGAVVPIDAGLRLTGRLGHERIGVLAIRTGGSENALDGVARVQHDVFARGYVGGMATYQGGPGPGRSRAAGGLDFQFPLLLHGQNLIPQGFVAVTGGDGTAPASAWRLFLDYPNDKANHFLAISRIEGGFDPALGFVLQQGVQRQTGQLEFFPRPRRQRFIRKFDLKLIEFDISENLDGTRNHAFYEVRPLGAEFAGGGSFAFNLQHFDDAPPAAFEIFPGSVVSAGHYGWNRVELQAGTSQARPVSVELGGSTGGFYGGTGEELTYALGLRLEPHVITGVDGALQWIRFGTGRFAAQVHRARVDYALNPRLNGTLFVQWDNESDRLAVNARVHWIPRPGADAYLVWNSAWPTTLAGGIPWRRPQQGGLVGKVVWYFRA